MTHRATLGFAVPGGTLAITMIAYVLFVVVDGAPGTAFRNVSAAMEPTLLAGERFTVREIRGDSTVSISLGASRRPSADVLRAR
jgi:hypothetical protein